MNVIDKIAKQSSRPSNKSSLLLLLMFLLTPLFFSSVKQSIAAEGSLKGKEGSPYLFQVAVFPANDRPIQTVTLSEDIYNYSRDDYLRDLMVIDDSGNPLPFEISIQEKIISQHKKDIALYPLYQSRDLEQQTDSVSFKYDKKNRLVETRTSSDAKVKNQVVGYLLDLGDAFFNSNRLISNATIRFSLSDAAETSFLRFNLDQSDQLKRWTSISRGEVLAQLYDQDKQSQLNQIKMPAFSARYLRISLTGRAADFSILSAQLEYTKQRALPLIWSQAKTALFEPSEQAYIVDISPSLAYRRFSLELPRSPAVLRGKLYSRTNNQSVWKLIKEINFFSIQDDKKTILQNELFLQGSRASQLKIKLDYPISTANKSLSVKLAWNPQKLTFFSNGNDPYAITVGGPNLKIPELQKNNLDSNPNYNKNQALFSMIKNQISDSTEEARLGESILQEQKAPLERKFNWQKIILWLVLIVGVLLMAWMAKRLLKKVD